MATAAALGKINVTSNLRELEEDAKRLYKELEAAEKEFEPGLKFGQAMIDLRNSEGMKHGDWMTTLKRLGITYRKADYWMNMVKWENGERPKSPKNAKREVGELSGWDAASRWLDSLRDRVTQLKIRSPKGAKDFAAELSKLAAELRGKGGRKR